MELKEQIWESGYAIKSWTIKKAKQPYTEAPNRLF